MQAAEATKEEEVKKLEEEEEAMKDEMALGPGLPQVPALIGPGLPQAAALNLSKRVDPELIPGAEPSPMPRLDRGLCERRIGISRPGAALLMPPLPPLQQFHPSPEALELVAKLKMPAPPPPVQQFNHTPETLERMAQKRRQAPEPIPIRTVPASVLLAPRLGQTRLEDLPLRHQTVVALWAQQVNLVTGERTELHPVPVSDPRHPLNQTLTKKD